MTHKRYRIEGSSAVACRPALHGYSAGLPPSEPPTVLGDASGKIERLAVELHAMRDAIATTKREMRELQRSPAGAGDMHRAASELDAVSRATERAALTILGAVEEIEAAANLLRATGDLALDRNDPLGVILDRVLVLYEACNFQDIAGQRIRNVLHTLQFLDERLQRVIGAWKLDPPPRPVLTAGPSAKPVAGTLSGPKLPGDEGHVSQVDVDAFFG